MTRYNYNQQVAPPAPFVYVTIARPDDGAEMANIPAQLDTAADKTVVPWDIVEGLRLQQLDQVPILGFAGHVTSVPTFLVKINIREFEPLTVEVQGQREEPFVLLGRDVLNTRRVQLDGPSLVLDIN